MRRGRSSAARFAAPVAFLLAVTVAVLLVRSGLSNESGTPAGSTAPRTSPAATDTAPATTNPGKAGARYYRVQEGDTLADVASAHGTTVERLLVLNPDVDPVALRIGQRLRVK